MPSAFQPFPPPSIVATSASYRHHRLQGTAPPVFFSDPRTSMDIKLKTSEILLQKLAFGHGEAKLQAASEVRLFARWDENNRLSLVKAGAIPLLIDLLHNQDPKLQENAVTTLLNLSISYAHKASITTCPGAMDALTAVIDHAESMDARSNGAALLHSLLVDENLRPIVGERPHLISAVIRLLRDGPSRCKGDALKALFVIADCTPNKFVLVDAGIVPLLVSLVAFGKPKLTEDSMAVLAKVAACTQGSSALLQSDTAMSVILHVLDKGLSLRAMENAAGVLLNVCQCQGQVAVKEMLDSKTLIPSIRRLYCTRSERGKQKAYALMRALNVHMQVLDVQTAPGTGAYSMVELPVIDHNEHSISHQQPPCISEDDVPSQSDRYKHASKQKLHRKWIDRARSMFFSKHKTSS